MPNRSGKAYGLTILSPLKESHDQSATIKLKEKLLLFGNKGENPMRKVPNTYLSRFYILEDVFYESDPYDVEHLKSKYLVFTSNFHGELDDYLEGMFKAVENEIKEIWKNCYGFDTKMDAEGFKTYIKKCQVETTFFFNGSTADSLDEQLKSLYIKQEFSKFVFENAHKSADELQALFKEFVAKTKPHQDFPRWKPGEGNLDEIVDLGNN